MPLSKVLSGDPKVTPEENLEVSTEDIEASRYFLLANPITAGQAKISKLLLDPSELTGQSYSRIAVRYEKEHRGSSQDFLLKTQDDNFNRYWIAELNPPITPEDLNKISFMELDLVLARAKANAFRVGMKLGKA